MDKEHLVQDSTSKGDTTDHSHAHAHAHAEKPKVKNASHICLL